MKRTGCQTIRDRNPTVSEFSEKQAENVSELQSFTTLPTRMSAKSEAKMKFKSTLFVLSAVFLLFSCENRNSAVKSISSVEDFKQIVKSSGDRLLVFDLYADWCQPCRKLTPMLEKIAAENIGKTSIYKIDVMKYPKIADSFGADAIPFVAFVKSGKTVHTLKGLQSKNIYTNAINRLQ